MRSGLYPDVAFGVASRKRGISTVLGEQEPHAIEYGPEFPDELQVECLGLFGCYPREVLLFGRYEPGECRAREERAMPGSPPVGRDVAPLRRIGSVQESAVSRSLAREPHLDTDIPEGVPVRPYLGILCAEPGHARIPPRTPPWPERGLSLVSGRGRWSMLSGAYWLVPIFLDNMYE